MDLTRPDFVLNVLFHQKEINCAVLDAPPSHIYQGIQRKIIPKPHRPKKNPPNKNRSKSNVFVTGEKNLPNDMIITNLFIHIA